MTSKDRVLRLVKSLNDNASMDEILYKIYVFREIEHGLAEADRGELIDHERLREELSWS